MMGYIFVLLSVLFFSLTNITDKIVSSGKDRIFSLFTRYLFSLVSSFIMLIILGEKTRFPGLIYLIPLLLSGSIAYLVNLIMYSGLQKINTGTFFMIGYSYLIFLFFINILLYGNNEILSPIKTIIAFFFIGFVIYMTYISGKGKNKHEFLGYVFALLCAIGWTILFGVEGYMIKNDILTPIMTIFIIYLGSILTAIIVIFIKHIKTGWGKFTYNPKKILAPALGGILICAGSGSLLFAYRYIPLNIANILGISEMLLTTILAIFILKEKHPKKEIRKILFGFLILLIFVMVK